MNHLAHFHLAHPDSGLILGGLLADYYKGPVSASLDDDLVLGVTLHRSIDAFTDEHPALFSCRGHFPPELRRFAGILMDLSFDHYLARHWSTFSDDDLGEFCERTYAVLRGGRGRLCKQSRTMAQRMEQYDLLGHYRHWATVAKVAERIGSRFSRGNPFVAIDSQLDLLYTRMEQAFLEFYPELIAHARLQRMGSHPLT